MNQVTTCGGDFGRTILPLQPNLMRVAMGLTRNNAEAGDLVQDALERALREWGRFTPGTNARAWVTAILSRLFIDGWRRRRRRPPLVALDDFEVGSGVASPDPEPAPPPWENVSEADLEGAIATLPDPLRRVFELSAGGELSYGEIGATLGIPVNTVGTRLLRARRRLRVTLEARAAALPVSFLVPAPVAHACDRTLAPRSARRADLRANLRADLRADQSAKRSISARASVAQGVPLVSRPM